MSMVESTAAAASRIDTHAMAETGIAAPTRPHGRSYRAPSLARGPVLAGIAAGSLSTQKDVCWVARAAFGEDDFRWMIFRAWLRDDAPAWFRALYMRHGPAAGRWLTGRPHERALVRRLMLGAIRAKLGTGKSGI